MYCKIKYANYYKTNVRPLYKISPGTRYKKYLQSNNRLSDIDI